MPVRFRCSYCNQLLGIARRKVGTVVRCPTCAGQVVVPDRDAEDLDKGDDQPEPPLFERQDFDDLFNAPHRPDLEKGDEPQRLGPPVAVEQPVGAWGTHGEPEFDVQKLRPIPENEPQKGSPPRRAGLVLSPLVATLATVGVIAFVAAAFLCGLLVGFLLFRGS